MGSSQLKVLFYTPISLELAGGGERWLSEMLPPLLSEKITPRVVTTDFIPSGYTPKNVNHLIQELSEKGIELVVLKTLHPPHSLNLPLLPPNSVCTLARLVRQSDIIYFMNAYAFQDLLVWFVRQLAPDTRVICGQHAAIWQANPFHNLYVKTIGKFLLKRFDGFHVLNNRDAHVLAGWKVSSIYQIPNGVNTKRFHSCNSHDSSFKVLFIGRLDEQKGLNTLVDAINILASEHLEEFQDIDFIIGGMGPLSPTVQALAASYDNVTFLGYVSENQLSSLYCSANIFVLPSLRETFGLVVLEAMASGLPVIVSDIPGPRSLVEPSFSEKFPVNDSGALARAILRFEHIFYHDPDRFADMSSRARNICLQRYDWNVVAHQFAIMLHNIASYNST